MTNGTSAPRAAVTAIAGAAWVIAPHALQARVGGGSHSGSSHSAAVHSAGPSFAGSGSDNSWGGIVALLIVACIVWYVLRRIRAGPPAAQSTAPDAQVLPAAWTAAIGASTLAGVAASAGLRPAMPLAGGMLRARDPAFEMETFLQRAEMTFFLVKRGMQRNDAAAIRPYVNDAVFAAVSRQLANLQGQHRHALLESLNVRAVHLDDIRCDDDSQVIEVHFDLVYRTKILDDSNRIVADEGQDLRHGERWSFARAASARTPAGGGVTALQCPACGAELRLNLDGTCVHCRAAVTNGTIDWVVADVQPAAYGVSTDSRLAVSAASVAEGIAGLQAADPNFSADAFKSRVRQAFFALQDAWCRRNFDAGRAFLSPGAYFGWSAQLEGLAAEGRRNVMENLDVRSMEIKQIVHGRVFDDVTLRIHAVAADFEVDKDERLVFGDRSVQPFTEDWTFQRSLGVATLNKPGTLENTCPNCGAPVSLTQIGECRYCKAAVTSGKFDWVVSRIEQDDDGSGDRGAGYESARNEQAGLAVQAGGAIMGGLFAGLLAGGSSNDSGGEDW